MMYFQEIKKIREIMIEEIVDSCEGEEYIGFDTPITLINDNQKIVEIYPTKRVVTIDPDNHRCERHLNHLSVEALAIIMDRITSRKYMVY